ncbi:MAG TPA: T9SS C-terminal target domain-containing protein [Bacteroidia bacterium]|nr:T9SS C-terminal target domain-containing protein [Bacteroidia bacterium]
MKFPRSFIVFLITTIQFVLNEGVSLYAQPGCTDPQASNYNSSATQNDGSCVYAATTLSLTRLAGLDTPLLDESSGVSFFNEELWTHVDNSIPNLYRIDSTTGLSSQEITLSNALNTDWEDVTSGGGYTFVGDFGNNSGNRTDLKIFRVQQSLMNDTVAALTADTISFSYPDQIDFTPALNATRFDCEAFLYLQDSLHLFCKDWVNKRTRHYVVPAVPGTYVAELRDSLDANGLITSAAIASDGAIVLLGYDNVFPAPCFMWLLYDYPGRNFFDGNKRRFSLGSALTVGQVEGICFRENHYGYITNERFQQAIFNVDPQLWSFDLGPYIQSITTSIHESGNLKKHIGTSPNPFRYETVLRLKDDVLSGSRFILMSMEGKSLREEIVGGEEIRIKRKNLASGMYLYKIIQPDGNFFQGKLNVE